MSKRISPEQAINFINEHGYIYLSGNYINVFSKINVIDKEGYIVQVSINQINSMKKPSIIHKSNPYSLTNIGHYLELNQLPCKLGENDTYTSSTACLNFTCKCGNSFKTSWNSVRNGHKIKCDKCTGYNRNLSYNEVKLNLKQKGLDLITSPDKYKGVTLTPLICVDKGGYKYIVTYDQTMKRGSHPEAFHKCNPFTIENINTFLDKNTDGNYVCISNSYKSKFDELEFIHKKCGRKFSNKWTNINKPNKNGSVMKNYTGIRCPHCDNQSLESAHALILKQIWLHEYPDTIVEERSCINPKTGKSLPTDIVNHSQKIAIEIQSWFHDFEDQKIKDKIKRDYWISQGYKFYAIDHRDYSIIEMIQIFFPEIKSVPEYVDMEYSNKINDIKIQQLLNEGYSVEQCAKITKCSNHQIYDAIYGKRISYPSNYKNRCFTPVVQLSQTGDYIATYPSIIEAAHQTNNSAQNISSCIFMQRYYSKGFIWILESDYKNGNYELPTPKQAKFNIPTAQYDINNNYICSYSTIIEASKQTQISCTHIYNVITGKRKTTHGYIFKRL